MAALDLQAQRDKIQREIEALERSLGGSVSGEDSDDDLGEQLDADLETDDAFWEDGGSEADMCIQMNLVYQAVLQEKLQEVELLITQNKEQQEELLWELAGRKTQRAGVVNPYPLNLSIGHFLKPYFKDKVSGLGPPANQEMIERQAHTVKTFKDLRCKTWRLSDNSELRKAIFCDTLQRMLQPKILKLEYLQQKRDAAKRDIDKKFLTKQIQETEGEIDDINRMSEDALMGKRTNNHDWDKISNINFECVHSAERLQRMWQNSEHPDINKEKWSEEEIQKLQEIAESHHYVNWEGIAEELETNRTAFQCLQTFQNHNPEFKRKEFTKEEDEMLTEFVQRMRVGEHIPYLKISYFMEGRNGMQLGCRWTKSLDPSIKKGPWSKEEDKMLLKAVAKRGGKEWYKIQFDVPGRNDIQCRERYVKALNKNLKKGKWSSDEKDKLVELTAKYGVGHWSQVSSELPHRTGSQCLSKWKNLTGYFKGRKRKTYKKRPKSPTPSKSPKPGKQPIRRKRKVKKKVVSDEEMSEEGINEDEMRDEGINEDEMRDEGINDEKMGDEGTSDDEMGDEGINDEKMGDEGTSDDEMGDEGINDEKMGDERVKDEAIQDDGIKDEEMCDEGIKDEEMLYEGIKDEETSDGTTCSSSSSSESSFVLSSSESENEDTELSDSEEEEIFSLLRSVPNLDFWVPRRSLNLQATTFLVQASSFSSNKVKEEKPKSRRKNTKGDFQFNTILKGIAYPTSTDIVTEAVQDLLKEAEEDGRQILQIQEDDVQRVLMRNTKDTAMKQIQRLKQRPSKPEESGEALSQFAGIFRASVDRKLLLAVTPWVGNVFLPVSTSCRRQTRRTTEADWINKKLSYLSISSTPIFTLLIQFFQIDAEGCLQTIRQRRTEQSQYLRDAMWAKGILDQSGSGQQCFPPPRRRGRPRSRLTFPLDRPKTVFELLLEKRMQQQANPSNSALPSDVPGPATPQTVIQQPLSPTARPQPLKLPLPRAAAKKGAQPVGPRSGGPVPARQPSQSRPCALPSVLALQPSRVTPCALPSVPAPQPLLQQQGSVMMLPTIVCPSPNCGDPPITFIVTPQGLIPITGQALDQAVKRGSGVVPVPSSNGASVASMTQLPIGRVSNVAARPLLSPTISITPGNAVTSLVASQPIVAASVLPTLALSDASKTSRTLPAVTNSTTTPPIVSCPRVAGPALPMVAPSDASKVAFQTLPAATSITHAGAAVTCSVVRRAPPASPCLPMLSPSDATRTPPHTGPGVTSSFTREGSVVVSSVIRHPQLTVPCLPMLSPSDATRTPPHTGPDVTSSFTREGAVVVSSVIRHPQIASPCLTSPSRISEIASQTLPTVISTLGNKYAAPISDVVSSMQEPGSTLPLAVASVSSPLSQTTTLVTSARQQDLAMAPSVGSPSQLAGPGLQILASSNASNMGFQTSPTITRLTAAMSPVVSSPPVPGHCLPGPAPSSVSAMPPQNSTKAASSLGQDGTAVTPSVISHSSCLAKSSIVAQLPNKEWQSKLTPDKYPIVRMARILSPRQNTVRVTRASHRSPVPNDSNQTSPSSTVGKGILDVSLISLEDESSVKEWLQGNKQDGASKGKGAVSYLPPSICTLKMLSRLLRQKTDLETNALKLLPSDVTETNSRTKEAIILKRKKKAINSMVEEKLKDNPAYQLLKQRFLSMFTIPGFMAVLPPIRVRCDSDEDAEDLVDVAEAAREENMADSTDGESADNMPGSEAAHEENMADPTDGESADNMPETEVPAQPEQGAAACSGSGESDSSEEIISRRIANSRTLT